MSREAGTVDAKADMLILSRIDNDIDWNWQRPDIEPRQICLVR